MSETLSVRVRAILWIAVILLPASVAASTPVAASPSSTTRIQVGNGTPQSCTETALQDALTTARLIGGGTIKFRCGANPVTIYVSAQTPLASGYLVTLNLPDRTTIDGDNKITIANALNASAEDSVIYVSADVTVILKDLSLGLGGVSFNRVIWNTGTLTLRNTSIFCPGDTSCFNGNVIYNDGSLLMQDSAVAGTILNGQYSGRQTSLSNSRTGTVAITGTVFSDNYGYGILNDGKIRIEDSQFVRQVNADFSAGAAIFNFGSIDVRKTAFADNDGYAGPIANGDSGVFLLKDSTVADSYSSYLGAFLNYGRATIDSTRFTNNRVADGGGAVFNQGTLSVRSSWFSGNQSGGYGGAFYNASTGTLDIRSSLFTNNSALYGGAIANGGLDLFTSSLNGGVLRISTSVITRNAASQHGGGIYSFNGTLQIDRSTQVIGNTPDDIYP